MALDLDSHAPVMLCDARDRASTKQVLVALMHHVMAGSHLVRTH